MTQVQLLTPSTGVPCRNITSVDTMATLATGRYICTSSANAATLGIVGSSFGIVDVFKGSTSGVAWYHAYNGTEQVARYSAGAWGAWTVVAHS